MLAGLPLCSFTARLFGLSVDVFFEGDARHFRREFHEQREATALVMEDLVQNVLAGLGVDDLEGFSLREVKVVANVDRRLFWPAVANVLGESVFKPIVSLPFFTGKFPDFLHTPLHPHGVTHEDVEELTWRDATTGLDV